MKIIFLMLIGGFISFNISAQDSTYYWYKGQRRYLKTASESEFVLINNLSSRSEIEESLRHQGIISVGVISTKTFKKNLISSEEVMYKWAIIDKNNVESLKVDSSKNILYTAPFFKSKKGIRIGISHLFYVKLRKGEDFSILQKIANESNVDILKQGKFMPLWYTLSCTKNSRGNSLEMANLFYETKLFEASEPNFLIDNLMQSVDDKYYDDQWGLNNSGQYGGTSGVDINIEDAWAITHGDKNITVAIIDKGIETNHPDLTNLSTYSYDTETESSPASILYGSHGMAVSGIISADADNNKGICKWQIRMYEK